jgi:hypothetical protein
MTSLVTIGTLANLTAGTRFTTAAWSSDSLTSIAGEIVVHFLAFSFSG